MLNPHIPQGCVIERISIFSTKPTNTSYAIVPRFVFSVCFGPAKHTADAKFMQLGLNTPSIWSEEPRFEVLLCLNRGWQSQLPLKPMETEPNRARAALYDTIFCLAWHCYRTHNTEFLKKVCPRLRYPASWLPLAVGASSRNLGQTFFRLSVVRQRSKVRAKWRFCSDEKATQTNEFMKPWYHWQ